jgi:hypothetical protein
MKPYRRYWTPYGWRRFVLIMVVLIVVGLWLELR